ncbi:MAG TPA: uracil-DNA glycosylase family protein [Solirubrobacteraceae bacterium]|nr:uracil-DNA glycosylase family protein [Solirubrobacteraceae bacterium]
MDPEQRPAAPAPRERSATERRDALKEVLAQARSCTRCPELAATRKTVVFGAGNADAELMFVGEAPGASEDEQGLPFVGRAGQLLNTLLGEIGLAREDVFIANTLKCLRYTARVQLGDGTWERIGRLVRSRYDGEVMSVDENGALVKRRVTGWHATPLAGRRVYRMTCRSCKHAGARRVGIQLTGDHPVLSERGYVPVEDLRADDRIASGQGLSELEWDVVCGSVLGDGCLQAASSCLTLSHSRSQLEYARFKAELLSRLGVHVREREVAAVAGGEHTYAVVHVRTLADRALRVLRGDFYRPHKVVPPWLADGLNSRMLAFWFMDDGYTRIREGGRRPLAEIATNAFSDADRQILIAGLAQLGLPAKATRRRLYFDVEATERLCELIAPCVPPSMRYKLHPGVETRVPFDCARFDHGPTRVLYDEVEVEDVTDRQRGDTTFFCLDVADTHNFVTAGGVVHNCRPPGNRDPQPIELENCQEYLLRQVELIEPTVICTLGNFSTKLLRGDPTGITRLHGQPEVMVLGVRAVRLYPIYHPAAALYTPRMLETLRTDFHRLPELLALGPPEQPSIEDVPELEPDPEPAEPAAQLGGEDTVAGREQADQLGLF